MHTLPAHRPDDLALTGKRGLRAAAVAILSLALVAGGALVATPASAAVTSRISGVVTSAQTGEALENIEVTLYAPFDPLSWNDEPIESYLTDSAGQYSFNRMPEGDYRVYYTDFNEVGYDDRDELYIDQFHGGAPGDYSGDVDSVTLGSAPLVINDELSVAGSYTGKILTSAGKPAAGVEVYAVAEGDTDDGWGEYTETAKNGTYTLTNLPYGNFTVHTYEFGTTPATSVTPAPLSASTTSVKVPTITLSKGSYITGRVLTAEGKPAKGIYMAAQDAEGTATGLSGLAGVTSSNSKGEYKVGPLLPGTYAPVAVQIGNANYERQYLGGSTDLYLARTVTLTKPGTTVSREFRLAKRSKVTGVVTNASGKAAKDVAVVAIQSDGTGSIDDSYASVDLGLTNAKGQYSIAGLNPGSYDTIFVTETNASGAPVEKAVVLKPGTTTVNARLGAVTAVSGVVTSSTGAALKGVMVEAVPMSDATECGALDGFPFGGSEPITTTATGAYTIVLPEGDWAIRFTDTTGRVTTGYLGGGAYPADAATTVVTASASVKKITGQNVTLSTAGTSVSAYVTSDAGLAEFPATVLLERLIDGEVVESPFINDCNGIQFSDESDDVNDQFPLRHLRDGDYRVTISPAYTASSYQVAEKVVAFTVAAGTVTTVDGENVDNGASLGDIVLDAPTRVAAPDDTEQPSVFAPDGVKVGATISAVVDYPGLVPDYSVYQWFRNGRPIAGATAQNYVVQSGDVGTSLTFQFGGASLSEQVGPLVSTPTSVVLDAVVTTPDDAPTVVGSARVGGSLSATPAAGDPAGTTYGYQWNLNGAELRGVITKTFSPRIQDLGETVSVTVTKTLPGADVTTGATSAGTVIGKGKAIVLSKPALLVNGTAKAKLYLGSTLSASIKGMPKDSIGAAFQWQVNRGKGWVNLNGSTSNTLTLSKKKSTTTGVGYSYRLVVSVERSGYDATAPITSNALKAYKKK